MFGENFEGGGDLVGKFAGGFKNEGTHGAWLPEVLENRKGEGGGFACSGLSGANDIFS